MTSLRHFAPKLGLAALLAATTLSTSAHAGAQSRAEAAIAEAKVKIEAGDKVGAGNQAPELQAQARQELLAAQDLLSNHHKPEAITAAHHASALADQALISANTRKAEAERARRDDLRDAAANAQQSAANANARADNAQQATTIANMRANSAEAASATANAQAEALRNAPPPPVAAPTTTTVAVTEHDSVTTPAATTHHIRHRVIHKRAKSIPGKSTHAKTTTTEITTTHP